MPRLNASQSTRVFQWKAKDAILLDKIAPDPPVTNTWYTVIDIKGGCKLYLLRVFHTNDEVAGKDVETELTIDDLAVGGGSNTLDSSKEYFFYAPPASLMPDQYVDTTPVLVGNQTAPIEYTNVKIRIRTTSVLGTNPELQCTVVYEAFEQL